MFKVKKAIGLMSGTSLDGIDAAILESGGEKIHAQGPTLFVPYEDKFRAELRSCLSGQGDSLKVENELTKLHAEVVAKLLDVAGLQLEQIDLIGFHGQTISHRPSEGLTCQIGDPSLLAELTGINVIADFRRKDMAVGGNGAPLVPLYHAALLKDYPKPIAIVNIGGIANVTWIGEKEGEILAFDTGPGNAMIDDMMLKFTGQPYDQGGHLGAAGMPDFSIINSYLADPFFSELPPKSLDRNYFTPGLTTRLPLEDAISTLTCLTAHSISSALRFFPSVPKSWILCGGGRHNLYLAEILRMQLAPAEVQNIDQLGLDGDFIEAGAFAYLAIRSYYRLPLSLPSTTGVARPVSGGALYLS
jgi:anhydro-N-acetylmuramic acid kinase